MFQGRTQRVVGVQGIRTLPEQSQNIGFLSNTGLDPLKSQSYQAGIQFWGHYRHASETPFKWRFAGGSMKARL